jgi:hypothetical protein
MKGILIILIFGLLAGGFLWVFANDFVGLIGAIICGTLLLLILFILLLWLFLTTSSTKS